jgi:DNA polymerase III subunit delta'
MGFDTFLGNAKTVANLRQMVSLGRVPGALLFSGPDGVGKKTLALMLAKALNCERMRDDFCGECARCQKTDAMLRAAQEDTARRRELKDSQARVEGLLYFDVHLIQPITRYILSEQIRQLRAAAYSRPFELRRRIFIIDEAQTIHWQAVDLLLKVLEEPPETTTLILISENPFDLRATIRSRCLRIPFTPVEDAIIETILRNEVRIPEARRMLASRVVAGSIARAKAFNLAEYEQRRRPWIDFLDSVAGRGPDSAVNWKGVFTSSKAIAEKRDEFEETLRVGSTLVADLLRTSTAGSHAVLVNMDLAERLRGWAANLGFKGITNLHTGLHRAYRLQIRNVNQELGLETQAVELAELALK